MAIKPFDPQAYIPVVWSDDPAVDKDASDMTDYIASIVRDPGTWKQRLKLRDGQTPTEFLVGVLPSAEANAAEDNRGAAARSWHSFLHSVRGIKGWPDKVPTVTRDGVEYVDPAWLAKTMVGPLRQCALEIGFIAYVWNNLSEADGKNS